MKRAVLSLLILSSISLRGYSDEKPQEKKEPCKKKYDNPVAPRDATVMSIMGWGVAIAVGIATLCALLDDSPGATTATTTTGGT